MKKKEFRVNILKALNQQQGLNEQLFALQEKMFNKLPVNVNLPEDMKEKMLWIEKHAKALYRDHHDIFTHGVVSMVAKEYWYAQFKKLKENQ